MRLDQALEKVGSQLGLDTNELKTYAAEDSIGGFDLGKGTWPVGSLWSDEGRFLYALVRGMKPNRVLELGAAYGCSATHILSALEANDKGKLYSIDLYPWSNERVPEHLKARWQFVGMDMNEYLDTASTAPRSKFDIVFEDGGHGPETEVTLRKVAARNPKLVISHDAEHFLVGEVMRKAFSTVFPDMQTLLLDGTDTGFAYHIRSE